jgi:WD40 repeat protein
MAGAGLDPVDADRMRSGIRRQVRRMLGRGGGWLRARTPKAALALLCAGAFAPLLVAGAPVTAAVAAVAVVGAVGAETLAEVIRKGLERLARDGEHTEERAAAVLFAEFEQALAADDENASRLRAAIAQIFQQVGVSSAALEAAGDPEAGGDVDARRAVTETLAQLGLEFTEFRFVLYDVQASVTRIEILLQDSQLDREADRRLLEQILSLLHRPASLRWPWYLETLRVIRSRTEELLDREYELAQIAAFATGAPEAFGSPVAASGYLRLGARPWAGKTALLAEAVGVLPPEVDVVAYFLAARDADASRERLCTAVVPQLAWLLGEDAPRADVEVFWDLWSRAAEEAETSGRHLLLVVDGLDEDLYSIRNSVAEALPPRRIGQHARVLVASRLHPGIPLDVRPEHPLRATPEVVLPDSPHANHIKLLAEQEISGLLRSEDQDPEFSYNVLGLLTAAAAALTVDDLTRMTGARTRVVRAFVTERAARSLELVPPVDEQGYSFAHTGLLELCESHPDVGGNPSYRARLHAWADEWRAEGWPPHATSASGTPRYLLDKYPELLGRATAGLVARPAEPERLAALAENMGWVDSAVSSLGVQQVIATLRQAAEILPGRPLVTSMFQLLQLQAHHLRPGDAAVRPGLTATQLGWEALRVGLDELVSGAAAHLERCPPPQLIPRWTTGRTGPQLVGVIGRHDDGVVGALAVSPDGRVVSGGTDGTVRMWDPGRPEDPGAVIGRHDDGAVGAVAVSPDGRVVSGGTDGTVRMWDPGRPEDPGAVIGRHERRWHPVLDRVIFGDGVAALAVLPDRRVISASGDDTIRMWDPSTPGDVGTVLGRHDGAHAVRTILDDDRVISADGVDCLAVLPDGRVASAGGDGAIRLWDPARPGADLGVLGQHSQYAAVLALAVLPGGRVVSGGSDGMVLVWDPRNPGDEGIVLSEHDAPVLTLTALPEADGRVVSGSGAMVRLWDPARLGPGTGLAGYFADVVAMLPDGRVLSQGEDKSVRLWNPSRPGEGAIQLGPHSGLISAAAWAPSGQLVTGTGGAGHVAVRLWDPARPAAPLAELEDPHDLWVSALAVLQDGRIVFGGADGPIWLWDPSQPAQEVAWLGKHDAVERNEIFGVQLAVLPNGQVISGGDDGFIRLWDPATPGDPIAELRWDEGAVTALAVLPAADGRVACGCGNGLVRIWDPGQPGDPGTVLGRHDGKVSTVAVLPDSRVVSGGGDGVVRLWNPDRVGDPVIELARHDGEVITIAVVAGGHEIAINSGRVTLFKLVP